ncbi:MAG TPA: histidine phosphatase family protein [Bacteroidales bacterium]|nr:histidine phosphatase family protein [Bacteroidales bacterium]HRZ49491.1 histidine phosphatase family protein [Bacteroidales bacterium]
MKQLILFRHGKSSWEDPSQGDAGRPLLEKGVRRTIRAAQALKQKGIVPDLLVSSHALRAHSTAGIVAEVFGLPTAEIVISEMLYHASVDRIWDVISSLPPEKKSVILFGHNPGFTEFANQSGLCRTDCIPTSGVAGGTFHCTHWHDCVITLPENTFHLWPAKLH